MNLFDYITPEQGQTSFCWDNDINEIERDDYNEESRQESIKRGREPRFYTRGSSTNIEGENIERNRDDRGTIRSTKKSFRVNGKEVITYGIRISNNSKETYNIVKNAKSTNVYGAFVDLKNIKGYGKNIKMYLINI